MDNKDLLKELESLKKRISDLESLKKDNLNMFGRSYNLVGSSDSDFLIKTKGLIKIQWGSKFIDLIKDGKINIDSKFIFTSEGSKNGIYVIGDEIYLQIELNKIPLISTLGTSYVSFLYPLDTNVEEKYLALKNIGLIYDSLEDALDVTHGIVYIEDLEKIYIATPEGLLEFTFSMPNPYTLLFVIAKDDNSKGALVIKGSSINNSLAFDNLYIYSEDGEANIDADSAINFYISGKQVIQVSNNTTKFLNTVIGLQFLSEGANSNSGFRLYIANGKSILEIDKLIVRDGLPQSDLEIIYPEYWITDTNSIKEITEDYSIVLNYKNTFKEGDTVLIYYKEVLDKEEDELGYITFNTIQAVIKSSEGQTIILDLEDESVLSSLSNEKIFKIYELEKESENEDEEEIKNTYFPIKIKGNSIEILDLDFKIGLLKDDLYGILSKYGIFENAEYKEHDTLPDDDDSTKFASTEWVNKHAKANIDIDFLISDPNISPTAYFDLYYINDLAESVPFLHQTTFVGLNGILTIAHNDPSTYYYAMVKAKNKSGSWSFRCLHAQKRDGVWVDSSTYVMDEIFNPGYYKSSNANYGVTVPAGAIEFIGTTNTETSSTAWPYIWYTNDGKNWVLKDAPITPDSSIIYVLATSSNAYQGKAAPAGVLATFDLYGNSTIYKGTSNYIGVDSGAISDWPGAAASIIQNLNASPGKVKQIPGFLYCFGINSSDWANRSDLNNWFIVSIPGLIQTASWTDLSLDYIDGIRFENMRAYWVNAYGTYIGDPIEYKINIDTFTNKDIEDIKLWLGLALNSYLIKSLYNSNWRERKYSVFSENTGYGGQYQNLVIKQSNGLGWVNIGAETGLEPPTSDSGPESVPRLHCNFYVDVLGGGCSIRGTLNCNFGGFDRSGLAGIPTGAKYLCSVFLIGTNNNNWSTSIGSDGAELFSLPLVTDIYANLEVYSDNRLYTVRINYIGSNEIFNTTQIT